MRVRVLSYSGKKPIEVVLDNLSRQSADFCVRSRGSLPKMQFSEKFLSTFFKKLEVMNCSPFFSWCGSFLCVTTKKRSYALIVSNFYFFIYSLIIFILKQPTRAESEVRVYERLRPNFRLRGIRLPAYLQANFVASHFARNSPACIFAGEFRSAKGIGERGFIFIKKNKRWR